MRRVVCAAVLALLACADPKQDAPASSSSIPTPDPAGRWVIVSHRIPGLSAMGDAAASAWHGRVVEITHERAISQRDTCEGIAFGHETRPAARFLGEGYHIAPFTLGIEDSLVTATWISCRGSNWTAPGGVLIWTHPDSVYAPWDGVFFRMARSR